MRHFYSGIAEVKKVRHRNDGVMIVEVVIYGLDFKTNTILIGFYEKGEKPVLPESRYASAIVSHKEIHEWIFRNKRWFKNAASIGLIKN